MVDKLLIGRKIAEIEVYLSQIKEYSEISVKNYEEDWKTQRIVERTLQILIEICMDIANHLISDKNMRLPTGYADAFKVLMENDVISKELSNTMEKMAKFRNIIVHQYEGIDSAIVVSILRKNLGDFEKYKKAVLKTLIY